MSTCKVDSQGRITTPSSWRASQGIEPGAELVILEEDGRLIVQTREQALREAQEIVRKYIPAGVSLTEELMKDRQREREIEKKRAQRGATDRRRG